MDSDIEEYTLLAASQFLDEVEAFLPTVGKKDLALSLNKVQQDTGVQLEIIATGAESAEDLYAESEEAILLKQNFEPVTKDRLNPLFAEIAPLLSEAHRAEFLTLSNDLGLNLDLTPSSPVLTAPPHPTMP